MSTDDDPVAVLQRWQDAGAVWRVVARGGGGGGGGVTVGLYQCDGGEEVDRITSTDPRLLRFLGDRSTSDQ